MGSGGFGGGIMFLVIALLWAAVLVPTWFRRREFNAAERNALRLQRTLRVLAETSEVPAEMHLEATAREALAHEKLLRIAQKRQEAEREADLAAARAEQVRAEIRAQEMQRKRVAMDRAAKLRRPVVRRLRSVAALLALGGVVGSLVGAGMMIAGIGPFALLWSLLAFTVGFGTLVLIAPGRAKLEPIAAEQLVEAPKASLETFDEAVETEDVDASVAAHAAAQRAAAERIERARIMARAREVRATTPRENQADSILLREARAQVARQQGTVLRGTDERRADEGTAALRSAAAPARPSRARPRIAEVSLADLDAVEDAGEGMLDLDQALRRRRAAN